MHSRMNLALKQPYSILAVLPRSLLLPIADDGVKWQDLGVR
jgi:hypothetical protein